MRIGLWPVRPQSLREALQDEIEVTRLKAGEILRSLVEIILTPEASELKIDQGPTEAV